MYIDTAHVRAAPILGKRRLIPFTFHPPDSCYHSIPILFWGRVSAKWFRNYSNSGVEIPQHGYWLPVMFLLFQRWCTVKLYTVQFQLRLMSTFRSLSFFNLSFSFGYRKCLDSYYFFFFCQASDLTWSPMRLRSKMCPPKFTRLLFCIIYLWFR